MPIKLENPVNKISCRIFTEDHKELLLFYPDIGYNTVIRSLVHKHVRNLKLRAQEHLENNPELLSPEDLSVR